MTYEAGALISKSETEKAFEEAKLLVEAIIKEVKARNPQMELKFEIEE